MWKVNKLNLKWNWNFTKCCCCFSYSYISFFLSFFLSCRCRPPYLYHRSRLNRGQPWLTLSLPSTPYSTRNQPLETVLQSYWQRGIPWYFVCPRIVSLTESLGKRLHLRFTTEVRPIVLEPRTAAATHLGLGSRWCTMTPRRPRKHIRRLYGDARVTPRGHYDLPAP